jgi:CDP-diacylglycerol--glycerol-3-phosphate 3-phosphatidyltransferase
MERERSPTRPRRSLRRLVGLDRSGPLPLQTRAGAPLRPWTLPNLVGYLRLASIPVFLYLALDSDDGRVASATLLYLWITLGDYVDGFLARATGQYSRLGALPDPVVDRLSALAGAIVCWHFEFLPRWALALLVVREVATVVLARISLRRGVDLEISWVGRVATFFTFTGLFWSLVIDSWITVAAFLVGVVLGIVATALYVQDARRRVGQLRAADAGALSQRSSST